MDGNTLVALLAIVVTLVLAIAGAILKFGTLTEQTRQNQAALVELSARTRGDQLTLERRQVKFEDDIRSALTGVTETIHRIDVRVAMIATRMGAPDGGESKIGG